ncbi:hypothetical protein AMECASPLE_011656 [Ameca splendens]|uniref:Uncharacterized protein n=1 Tax=Ameca splendens TaxID=208324 RepID=A0ABV0ZBK9_9TELE
MMNGWGSASEDERNFSSHRSSLGSSSDGSIFTHCSFAQALVAAADKAGYRLEGTSLSKRGKGLSHRPRPSSPFSTDGSTVGTHSLGHQRATRPTRKPRSQGTTPHRRDAGVDDLPPPPEPPPCQGQGRIQGARSASSMAPPTDRKASSLERTPMVRTGWALWTGQMMHAGATNQRMDVCHTTNHHSPPLEATAPLVQPPPRARRGHARPTGHDNHNSGLPRSMLNFLGPMDMENYSDPQGL